MKTVFNNTCRAMFKIIPTMVLIIIGMAAGGILALIYQQNTASVTTYQRLFQTMVDAYSIVAFILIIGILVWILCANSATGLFASEIHEKTMHLLLAKQITRVHLVFGKICGMLVGSIAYLIIAFASAWFIFMLFVNVDSDIIVLLLKYTLGYCLYGIIVIYIVGAIGSVLSTCFKKKVPAIMILVIAATLIFGMIPIIRIFLQDSGIYTQWHLYYLDINYHFSLLFGQCVNLFGGFEGINGGMLTVFTGVFESIKVDPDIALTTASMYTVSKTLNGILVSGAYLAIATLLYALTFRNMEKKDI